MVVTDAALGTKVGAEVLAQGGNAVDAAIATAFALAVAFPTAGNVGGGGFMVALIGGAPYALDFRETAPMAATRDMFLDASGKPTDGSRMGYRASGVPGSVAGLWEMYQRLGSKKKTWAELLAPAIRLADEGFDVEPPLAKSLADSADRFRPYPASASLFLPGGSPPAAGTRWRNPDLAEVLRRIAARGRDGFYTGPTADAIVATMKDKGLITARDLTEYEAKWRAPLELTYRGHRMIAMPPPSSGGVTLAMICHILEGYDLAKLGWHTPVELHLEFEAMRRGFAARNARLGDPDFVSNPVAELTSDAWAAAARATIRSDRATPSSEIPSAGSSNEGPHTTHFSVVDEDGDAVALTTTLNWWYGSGVTVAGAGFLMNNEMDDFASVPGTANGFGLVQGEPNAIAPGKRMLSSMSPTIVLGRDGKVELVLGGAGGPTIITAVFAELSNAIDFGLDAARAVDAPRFHMQHLPDVVLVEPHGLPEETAKALGAMGYSFKERSHIADAPAIGKDDAGWIGAAEPRRAGALAAGP
jgi:gamma-glutamyltranspeptidase / glutathione hydrolase